ncbi:MULTISPECIES: glyoxalase [Rhodobacterales]|uniref:glyoxalase n=1 Tax=Ascidiaceihabitans sp. TaxID=1872644 RepID=UPI003299B5A2
MDYENVSAEDFGKSLRGIGVNILVRSVGREASFLAGAFQAEMFQVSKDFAIAKIGDQVLQLHSDATYHSNPLLDLLPENPPRGAGVEIRLYDVDPDDAYLRAHGMADVTILQEPTDKPHGLREAYILCENGYAWVPSRPL